MLFTPEYLFSSVAAITPAFLAQRGIAALVLDVDNTLTAHGSQELPAEVAGRLAAKAIMAVMPAGYRVENKPPPRGKDVNDFLCHRLGIPIRGSHGKEPER